MIGAVVFLQRLRISPDSAFSVNDWTAIVIFMVVIGGIGTFEGPILGALIYFSLRETLSQLGPYYLIILGAVAIAVIQFTRGSLVSKFYFDVGAAFALRGGLCLEREWSRSIQQPGMPAIFSRMRHGRCSSASPRRSWWTCARWRSGTSWACPTSPAWAARSIVVEWQSFPTMALNPDFVASAAQRLEAGGAGRRRPTAPLPLRRALPFRGDRADESGIMHRRSISRAASKAIPNGSGHRGGDKWVESGGPAMAAGVAKIRSNDDKETSDRERDQARIDVIQ